MDKAPPILRYPKKNIQSGDDYLKIQILEYVAPSLNLTGGFALKTSEQALEEGDDLSSIRNPKGTIILPMPSNIQDSNSADWGSGQMNPVQGFLANTVYQGVMSKNLPNEVVKAFNKGGINLTQAIKTGEGQQALAAGVAVAGIKALLGEGDISQTISRATGMVFNQNVELLFGGVSMRPAFNFTFDMIPRSDAESKEIRDIIRLFKVSMSPMKGNTNKVSNGLFVKAPNVFKLEYMSGGTQHPFLHRFKPCALTSMSVNYNGSAQYATYSDATPVHMQLTLQFQELTPIYREDYVDQSGDFKLPGTGY